jgi:Asp-tRNA(Asn)/Glu-tRNA(Gln) amidotransferase A subunit family amidase
LLENEQALPENERVEENRSCLRIFASETHFSVEILDVPQSRGIDARHGRSCGRVAYAVHEPWLKEKPQDYGALARERLLAGATLRAVDYLQAVRWRLRLRDTVAAAFADIDVAVTASSLDPACRIDDEAALAANYCRQARMPFNVTGQPGLVIPAGFSASGLPLSLRLVGHPFTEPGLATERGRGDHVRPSPPTAAHPHILDKCWISLGRIAYKLLISLASPRGFEPLLPP